MCFETALFVNKNLVELANKYANELRCLTRKTLNVLGGNVNQFLSNLNLIDLSKVTFRIPVTKYSLADAIEICNLIKNTPK